MSKRQLIATVCGLATVLVIAAIVAVVSIKRYEKQAVVNAQTEIERTKIEEAARLERTRERMNWIPWYEGGQNRDE